MSEKFIYAIQMYSPEDERWIDCEDGVYFGGDKKLDMAFNKIHDWHSAIPDEALRLVKRTEEIIITLASEEASPEEIEETETETEEGSNQ